MPSTKLFRIDLNKSVPPWRRTSWRDRYSHTMRMQNQAKLAAGAHREHMVKHMSTCLHWSAAVMPAAALRAVTILGGGFTVRSCFRDSGRNWDMFRGHTRLRKTYPETVVLSCLWERINQTESNLTTVKKKWYGSCVERGMGYFGDSGLKPKKKSLTKQGFVVPKCVPVAEQKFSKLRLGLACKRCEKVSRARGREPGQSG